MGQALLMRPTTEHVRCDHDDRPHPPRAARWPRAAAGLALAVLVAAGCGSSGSDAGSRHATTRPPTTTARPTTTVDQEAADKAEITATFNGWVKLEKQFEMEKLKWSDDIALKYIDGPFILRSRDWITKWQAEGRSARKPAHPIKSETFEFRSLNRSSAIVDTCQVNDYIALAKDGSVIDDGIAAHFATVEFRHVGGHWRIWNVTDQQVQRGLKTCMA